MNSVLKGRDMLNYLVTCALSIETFDLKVVFSFWISVKIYTQSNSVRFLKQFAAGIRK